MPDDPEWIAFVIGRASNYDDDCIIVAIDVLTQFVVIVKLLVYCLLLFVLCFWLMFVICMYSLPTVDS